MNPSFKYFKYNPTIIQLAVLLYIRYPLSLRQVEDMLFERGIDICHETIRLWWNKFGPFMAAQIRKKRFSYPKQYSPWRWHIDEVFVKINGKTYYLWRAVDHEGEVLDAVVTKKRYKKAALKVLKHLMKRYGRPHSIVTDKLGSYGAAMREIGCQSLQKTGGRLNNRAENSHLPFRRRERAMQHFRNEETLQKFVSIHSQVYNHFNGERHLNNREKFKNFRSEANSE
jgi:putative transposase